MCSVYYIASEKTTNSPFCQVKESTFTKGDIEADHANSASLDEHC